MSGRNRFAIESLSSSDDTSSEDFHPSSSDETEPKYDIPRYELYANEYSQSYEEGSERQQSDIEEEIMDYEGRDTIPAVSEYRVPILRRPLGHGGSHMARLNMFQDASLLDQSENRTRSFGAYDMYQEDDEDYDIDVEEDMIFQNSLSPADDSRNSASQERRHENVVEEGGAIEVDEPFISQPMKFPVLPKPQEPIAFGKDIEIKLEKFPEGHQMHRSFRVGWGPNGSLVIPRRANFEAKEPQNMEAKTYVSPVTISQIQVLSNAHTTVQPRPLKEAKEKKQDFSNEIFLLEQHLFYSKKKKPTKPNGLTYFTVSKPDELIKVNRKGGPSRDEKYKYESEIWYLVEMLWGTPSDIFANDPSSSYSHQLYRRNALSRWFSDTTASSAEEDIRSLPKDISAEEKECATIFYYLTTKKISEAVEVALQEKDFRFAALVSQAASSNALFKKNIETQVIQWNNMKSFDVINQYRQYIYHVLSGEIKGGASFVDWRRGLALYFWYGRDVSMKYDKFDNLQLALSLYENACKKSEARPPLPDYLLKPAYKDKLEEEPDIFDLSYHLLKLFSQPETYSIEQVLQPKNYDEHLFNYHLSWHLHKVLRAVIDVSAMGPELARRWNVLDYEVTMNYAFQLETMGHWEWALYVLLNIYSPFENLSLKFSQLVPQSSDNDNVQQQKHSHYPSDIGSTYVIEHAFREILNRNVADLVAHPEKRNFLTQDLEIPETWIKAAEAIYQHYKKNYRVELDLLIESQQWEAAHRNLMDNLLYQLILHEKYQELTHLLQILSNHIKELEEWHNKGGLFLNFLKLIEKCKTVIQLENVATKDLERLVFELNQILQKIQVWQKNNSSHVKNSLQEACIGEMSTIIHSQITKISVKNPSINGGFNRAQIDLQVLPNDLVKNHLDFTISQFVRNATKI